MSAIESLRVSAEVQIRTVLEDTSLPLERLDLSQDVVDVENVRGCIDQALKNLLWEYLDVQAKTQKPDGLVFGRLMDAVVFLAEKELASPNLPAYMLTDIFETLTISKCEQLFHLMEDRIEVWKRDVFFVPCKNQLLRMCNDLLRRLSKNQNTVFCGQILIVLAKLFPLSERSGLNIVSEFNTENISIVSQENEDGGEDQKLTEDTGLKVDYGLYRKFWSLQEYFRQPNLCYNFTHWKQLISYSQDILNVFFSFKLDDTVTTSKPQLYFAKYLTSKKLFDLELSDSNFRRYILIQFLILFQYLRATVRFKLESQTLSEEQAGWVRQKSSEIYQLLEETPPDGKEFAGAIKNMLSREECWNAWKNDNCPAFKVAKPMDKATMRRKRRVGNDIKEHLARGKIAMGNAELTRLFNICPDNWEACRTERRNFLPSMEEFFADAIMQADPANMVEEEYKNINNPNWGWRALRLLSQKSLHFFTSTNQPARTLPNYLDTMVQHLAKDLSSHKDSKDNGLKVEGDEDNSQDEFKDEESEKVAPGGVDEASNDDLDALQPAKKRRISVSMESSGGDGSSSLSADLIDRISSLLGEDYRKLVPHMGFHDDDLQYVQGEIEEASKQAKHLLTLWKERNPLDANLESLKQIASKVGLVSLVEQV